MMWIPVSKELPKRDKNVLFQGTCEGMYIGRFMGDKCGENVWFRTWQDNRYKRIRCVAWMPLPAPYKENT